MNTHFSSFTPEAMQAFGRQLATDSRRRAEFNRRIRAQAMDTLAASRRERGELEPRRLQQSERDADTRRLFTSELRSGVHALMGRFELGRKEVASDLRTMASELRAACDALRNRPRRHGAPSRFA